jgi:hypothetical protein
VRAGDDRASDRMIHQLERGPVLVDVRDERIPRLTSGR